MCVCNMLAVSFCHTECDLRSRPASSSIHPTRQGSINVEGHLLARVTRLDVDHIVRGKLRTGCTMIAVAHFSTSLAAQHPLPHSRQELHLGCARGSVVWNSRS